MEWVRQFGTATIALSIFSAGTTGCSKSGPGPDTTPKWAQLKFELHQFIRRHADWYEWSLTEVRIGPQLAKDLDLLRAGRYQGLPSILYDFPHIYNNQRQEKTIQWEIHEGRLHGFLETIRKHNSPLSSPPGGKTQTRTVFGGSDVKFHVGEEAFPVEVVRFKNPNRLFVKIPERFSRTGGAFHGETDSFLVLPGTLLGAEYARQPEGKTMIFLGVRPIDGTPTLISFAFDLLIIFLLLGWALTRRSSKAWTVLVAYLLFAIAIGAGPIFPRGVGSFGIYDVVTIRIVCRIIFGIGILVSYRLFIRREIAAKNLAASLRETQPE